MTQHAMITNTRTGQKPEWLTWEEILQYERRMTEEDKRLQIFEC